MMTLERIREICLNQPGATENVQWGADLVFKVAEKMFLCMGADLGASNKFSLKCDDESFHELTEQPGIVPAPYLAGAQWVMIDLDECDLRSAHIEELVQRSYQLVVAKLPKNTQTLVLGGGRAPQSTSPQGAYRTKPAGSSKPVAPGKAAPVRRKKAAKKSPAKRPIPRKVKRKKK